MVMLIENRDVEHYLDYHDQDQDQDLDIIFFQDDVNGSSAE